VVDVHGPYGPVLAAVGTGDLREIAAPADGVTARLCQVQPLVELRVPFTLSRQAIDDVERGAQDPDWQPVKDAARKLALAEDRAVFEGYPAAGITGIRAATSNPVLSLPADVHGYADVVSQAVASLRPVGVGGRIRSCSARTHTPQSARLRTTGTRFASSSRAWWTARSCGRRLST
jgi:uncharacterized linocin/CFP29 family protein